MYHSIKPKKSLGQNFLKDNNIASKIVGALDINEGDTVIEIGPGTGILTGLILEKKCFLTAVEIDKRAVDVLNTGFPETKYPNFEIINSDILETGLPETGSKKKYKVVGNLPYYISSQVLFQLFDSSERVDKAIIMLQKEVARRLTAKSRTKDYGILTVTLGLKGDARILFDVPPSCFYPEPKVTSSVVEINFGDALVTKTEYTEIKKFVRAAFSQRRKTLKNSLKQYINEKSIILNEDERILNYFCKRAEELSVNDFIELFNLLNGQKKV